MSLKTCFKCSRELPRAEFYKHAQMGDGLLGKCKGCTKRDVMTHRQQNVERIRAYDRARGSRQTTVYQNQYRKANRHKQRAHRAVQYALSKGRLTRAPACWHCGSDFRIEAHHASYSRDMRLAVTWLCSVCHSAIHRRAS